MAMGYPILYIYICAYSFFSNLTTDFEFDLQLASQSRQGIGMWLEFASSYESLSFDCIPYGTSSDRQENTFSLLAPYWRPLLGTAGCWFLFDIVEYGLKQNDAAIFDAGNDAPYSQSVMDVFLTRLLVIPSLIFAPWLLTRTSSNLAFWHCFSHTQLILSFLWMSWEAGCMYLAEFICRRIQELRCLTLNHWTFMCPPVLLAKNMKATTVISILLAGGVCSSKASACSLLALWGVELRIWS